MDYYQRKWIEAISEGITKYKIKKTGNPYAALQVELNEQSEWEMAEEIYNFLEQMEMIK